MLLAGETGEVTEEPTAGRTACVVGAFNLQPERHLGAQGRIAKHASELRERSASSDGCPWGRHCGRPRPWCEEQGEERGGGGGICGVE